MPFTSGNSLGWRMLKRSFVTLVEMLVVFAMISLIAGAVAINIRGALQEQRFRTELSQFVDMLRMAQDLMLIADADIHVKVVQCPDDSCIKYWMESEGALPGNLDAELKRASKKLTTIRHVSHQEAAGGVIDLKFLSGGCVMSKGTICLSAATNPDEKNVLTRFINLTGYPKPIVASFEDEERLQEKNSISDYGDELTKWTVQEIKTLDETDDKKS